MKEFEFRVLCANNNSCSFVRNVMKDFKITLANKTDDFDHKGVKQFNSRAKAVQRADEIKSLAGENLIDITMHIRR